MFVSSNATFLNFLRDVVGHRHVITSKKKMTRYCTGYRSGVGEAIAVVRPGTLIEQWRVLELCIKNNKIIIMQAANTGLTEGSTPSGTYDRDAVIINTMRMNEIHLLGEGEQILSLPGATLFKLEKILKTVGRQTHSVIGSSCIGASITGGVCNNSGGALISRGPAYTEMALYARVSSEGELELVNELNINLGNEPITMLSRLQNREYTQKDILYTKAKASDSDYHHKVRQVNEDTPARFNANPERLFGASGCAGKLAVFALRLDTFPTSDSETTFYIGSKDTKTLTKIRRDMLTNFQCLPVSAEYMHRDCYDISKKYGKDTVILIDKLGTDRLPQFFAIKDWLDRNMNKLRFIPNNLFDWMLQGISALWPNILPRRMEEFRQRYEHHLILKAQDSGIEETSKYLQSVRDVGELDFFTCNPRESKIASLHRFAAAGAAVRYMSLHHNKVSDIIALDIALRRNDTDWFEKLPEKLDDAVLHKLYYGHFFCHVLHQDYIVKRDRDPGSLKVEMLKILEKRGAKYPAEHNVGHMYKADKPLAKFYEKCDPTNTFNPGLGGGSKYERYAKPTSK
tara:strand:- start:39 stop:1748 length:1710 start_codon:yes stop_codon:yes gene_type:complete